MVSARAIANRKNAGRSTGPRSEAGKRAAAGNALRHGLNVAITTDMPAVAKLVQELSEQLDREDGDLAVLEAARSIVAYQRIQSAYAFLYARAAEPIVLLSTGDKPVIRPASNDLRAPLTTDVRIEAQHRQPAFSGLLSLTELTQELDRLERYERRAFSARKTALRRLLSKDGKPAG